MALKRVHCNEMLLRMHPGEWSIHLMAIFGVEKYSSGCLGAKSGSCAGVSAIEFAFPKSRGGARASGRERGYVATETGEIF